MTAVRVGTRGSALALWQAHHVADWLQRAMPDVPVTLVEIVTAGDEQCDVPLMEFEGAGLFTAALDRALLAGDVDVVVHSFKDVPVAMAAGLAVAAVPRRGPVEDVLCARDGLTLATLPPGARVGTCSARRAAQVRAMRADVVLRPLRGNVPTRLARVALGYLDAVVLARAGLVRLALEAHVTEVFPVSRMLPAPAQGALAVVCRADDFALQATLAALDDASAHAEVDAERSLLCALGGGCAIPVGAAARRIGGTLRLSAGVFSIDGRQQIRVETDGSDATALGALAARRLLAAGADALLAEFQKMARRDEPASHGAPS